MPDKSITLFSKGADLLPVRSGPAGLLFESAPDGMAFRHYPQAIPLNDLIGDFNETHRRASELARKLLSGEPEYRGVQQLAIFEEVICKELQQVFHLLQLHEKLLRAGFTHCEFVGASRDAGDLSWLAGHLRSNLTVSFPGAAGRKSQWSSIQRSWRRLRAARFSHRLFLSEWRQVLDRIDPYHRRDRLELRGSRWALNKTWFYTTAHTFTGIGLLFEPYFPQAFQYLVENPLTGGEPLRASGRTWVSLYRFGKKCMEPSAAERRATEETIVSHLNSVSLEENEGTALRMLLNSGFFQAFLARHLPAGLYASALFERWAEKTRPAGLVVGNFVFEGYALHAARRRGIQTIMLQHGTLGDDYQLLDPPVDHFVVRGTFWRDFLPAVVRARAIALGPPGADKASGQVTASRDAIVFITTPYELLEFWHTTDLDDILGTLLSVAAEQGRELIVRVHPLEDVEYYRICIRRMMRVNLGAVKISYSQGPGLDDVLSRAAVAVLYCSTVLLDCLRHRVPMVSFAWHYFNFKQRSMEYGLFHFAEDLADLTRLLEKGLKGELPAYLKSLDPFLANTPAKVLRDRLVRFIQPNAKEFRGADA